MAPGDAARARWERVQTVFHAALDRPPAERKAFVESQAAGDATLAAEAWSLIEADAEDHPLLDAGLPGVAPAILTHEPEAGGLAFGPYRTTRLLGEGGMGVVYEARRDDLDRRVAIKVLGQAWLSSARRDRFAEEQTLLAHLEHPGIARLYEADVLADGTPWFAMELVDGIPITEYADARGLDLVARLELLRAVAEAVAYAHAMLVVHRDLKPSNILVTTEGRPKLLDFGIAKRVDPGTTAEPTLTAQRWLTPAYAAPEQIRGGAVGAHTDVYGLGVLAYELLARRKPFDVARRTPAEAEALVTTTDPPAPSASPGRVPAGRAAWSDLDVLCLTAMRKEPERRYRSVEAFVRDLDHFLGGTPLEARPDALAYRAGKFLRRRWPTLAAGAAVVMALSGVAGVYTWRLERARAEAVGESARAARIQQFLTELFEGGDDAGPSEDLRVRTLIDRGARDVEALSADPLVKADLQRTLGGLYQKLGDFTRAETLITAALDAQVLGLGDGSAETGDTRVALGLVRLDQARLDEAEALVRAGLDASRRLRSDPHPSTARAVAALGQVLEARGDLDGAIAAAEEAVRLTARIDDSGAAHAAALGQLADAHYYAGHYDTADATNQDVLARVRRLYGERHPRVADVLINLGASQVDRGRYAEADAYYRPALDILSAFYGPDHYRVASAETMLGRALVYQQRFDDGVPLLAHALSVQERVHGLVHPRVASALNDLGSAALQQGRLADAEAYFTRMRDVYVRVYDPPHALIATATSNLASVFVARSDYARAEGLYRQAIAMYEAAQGADHLNAGIGRIKLGRALLRQGRLADAERESLAGYAVVSARASPTVSWLESARADLREIYTTLGQPGKAAAFASLRPDTGK